MVIKVRGIRRLLPAAVAAAALSLALGAFAAPASAATQNASVGGPRWQTGRWTTLAEVTAAHGGTAVVAPLGISATPSAVGVCTDSSGFHLGGQFFCGDAYGIGLTNALRVEFAP